MAAVWQRSWSGGGGSWQPISGSTTSTSGTTTTLSTATNTASSDLFGERPLVMEENAEELHQERAMEFKQEVAKTRLHMRGLVEEFCAGANGNVTAPNRWLSELHVAWLLRLAELGAAAQRIFISRQLHRLVMTWTLALQVISKSICRCLSSGLDREEEASVGPPALSELAKFVRATLLKMFTFVDAVAALAPLNPDDPSGKNHVFSSSVVGAAEKLRAQLEVRDALSMASEQMMMSFSSSTCPQSTGVTCDIGGFLSEVLGKLDHAVRDAFDQIRTALVPSLDDDDDSCSRGSTQILQSDIHKVTRSVINYISMVSPKAFLPVNLGPRHGGTCYVLQPHQKDMCYMTTTLIMEMVGSLQEELARASKSFPDQSLRFIFLINNFYFIRQQLEAICTMDGLTHFLSGLTHRINRYIHGYLQVSWAPVLKCLNNSTVHCFKRNSPLRKFESKFQKTYAAQKLWKVPDTELRKKLRETITRMVVSGVLEYLEHNNSITPGVSPQELQEVLQELFEG